MLTIEKINGYKKDQLPEIADKLDSADIKLLVTLLNEKDNELRYKAFLLLQHRSGINSDVYPYFDELVNKLKNDNSYQRSIGIMLIADNTKWDKTKKFNQIINLYLSFTNDEKVITARQCLQSLPKIINYFNYDEKICNEIINTITNLDLTKRPETNYKVMLTDIVNVLIMLQKELNNPKIVRYLNNVVNENKIDKKLITEIKELLA